VARRGFGPQFSEPEREWSREPRECPCVRLLRGQAHPENEPATPAESPLFCDHSSLELARRGARPPDCTRAACAYAGCESLAHAPIRHRNLLLGDLYLADEQAGKFPAETRAFVEAAVPLIGEAIHRFEVEQSLHESESRFRSMFERHQAIMLLVEPASGALVDANLAAAAFYGYSQEDLRRMKLQDLSRLPLPALPDQLLRLPAENDEPFVLLQQLANGRTRIVEVHSSPIKVGGRELFFSILHDITERRELEKQVLDVSEQERQRVGRDLHDSLGGELTGAALMGEALAQKLAARGLAEAELAQEVVRSINTSIGHTRVIARGLCPVELSVSGLVASLSAFVAETQRRSGVTCRFVADKNVDIPDLFRATHLFRIAQEAVSNALRHGQPRHITVRMAADGGCVTLEIQDDGKGLPPSPTATNGLGLRTMKYRGDLMGARLTVKPGERGGTVVACRLPLGAGLARRGTRPATTTLTVG
jgi:PAS domain S-box-containing protein